MHCLLARKSLRREKDRRKPDWIGGERWPKRETEGRTDAPNPNRKVHELHPSEYPDQSSPDADQRRWGPGIPR